MPIDNAIAPHVVGRGHYQCRGGLYVLAVATQILVFPWFGLHPSLGENLALGGVFVGISLLRSYALRRLFERIDGR